jgi:hypothetical protein
MFGRFHRVCAEVTFHPMGRRPALSGLLEESPLGDD